MKKVLSVLVVSFMLICSNVVFACDCCDCGKDCKCECHKICDDNCECGCKKGEKCTCKKDCTCNCGCKSKFLKFFKKKNCNCNK